MKKIIVIGLLLSIKSFSRDFSGTINGAVTINILLGTQLKAVNLGLSIFGTTTYKSNTSFEGGINFNFSPFIQKYGIYQGNTSGSLELFGLAGYGQNNNLLGSNAGLTKHTAFYDYKVKNGKFYGIGMVVILNKIFGDLKKFGNKQGGFILRFSTRQNSVVFNMVNDVNARPFTKSGTDMGSTARAMLSYTTIKGIELYGFGFGLDMFTPEADYGQAPRGGNNDEDGTVAVLINTKPYDDLFHLNLFTSVVYQSMNNNINFDGRIGVDSYKLGAFVQNRIHDNFGLYPRFSWPVTKKNRFYSLLDLNTFYNQDFNE
ncbi:MAG: hypothetical protein JKY30_11100 [Flavobacteriales bacterium]|nr:hypothetical protein [Flavobacteriales bacterium]